MIFLVTMMILVMEQRSICLMVKLLKQESRAIFGKGVLCASRPPPYFVSMFCSSFTLFSSNSSNIILAKRNENTNTDAKIQIQSRKYDYKQSPTPLLCFNVLLILHPSCCYIHEIIESQQTDKEPNLFGTLGFLGSVNCD